MTNSDVLILLKYTLTIFSFFASILLFAKLADVAINYIASKNDIINAVIAISIMLPSSFGVISLLEKIK